MKQKHLIYFLMFLLFVGLCLTYLLFQCPFEPKISGLPKPQNAGYLELTYFMDLPVCGPGNSSFATLLGVLGAVIAAIIAFTAVEKQIAEQRKIASDDRQKYKAQALVSERERIEHRGAVAKAISADMKSLVKRIEDLELNNFESVKSGLLAIQFTKSTYSPIIIDKNYHTVFDTLIKDIMFLPIKIVDDVFEWYNSAKSFIETINLTKENMKCSDVVIDSEAKNVSDFASKLISKANDIISGLRSVAVNQEELSNARTSELNSMSIFH